MIKTGTKTRVWSKLVPKNMKHKNMKIMLIFLAVLFGGIFIYKTIIKFIIVNSIKNQNKVISVSAMKVSSSEWTPKLNAVASLRAIRGVYVTTQLAGMVQTIYFKPGTIAKEHEILVQLNADNDIALLNSLKANAELAKTTYLRDKAQYSIHVVSKQTLDTDAANLKSLEAQVVQQAAIVNKKTIRAPFDGRLGINQINPGQFLNPGDKVVNLQTLNPLYADFNLPQQTLAQLKVGQEVVLSTDAYPQKLFKGKITTIDPAVDSATRNILVEATLSNSQQELLPGMFGTIEITLGNPSHSITLPQTAISFNPYGDIVYLIKKTDKQIDGKFSYIAKQHFVTTGETRGEQIKILQGLKEGDEIVTSGQLKLKNGSVVVINNSIQPSNNPDPKLKNNH